MKVLQLSHACAGAKIGFDGWIRNTPSFPPFATMIMKIELRGLFSLPEDYFWHTGNINKGSAKGNKLGECVNMILNQ